MIFRQLAYVAVGGACVLAGIAGGGDLGLGPGDLPDSVLAARRMVVDSPYSRDSAGARLLFETDATDLVLRVRFAHQQEMPTHTHLLSVGEWRVDGTTRTGFARLWLEGGEQAVALSLDGPRRPRTHEILLPLSDRTEFVGLAVDAETTLCRPVVPAAPTIVAYGDSITQGFFASRPSRSYPDRLAQATGWNVLNLGFSGRRTSPSDALAIAALRPDGIIVLIGENDALFDTDMEEFRARFRRFLGTLSWTCPAVPVWVGTPTPVSGRKYTAMHLDEYRQAIRDIVAEAGPAFHLLEGADLLPARSALVKDGLHPNDAGFAVLARALETALRGTWPSSDGQAAGPR